MSDLIEQYKQRVRKRLCRPEDQSAIREAEALCFPSFHPETLLRATGGPNGTTFRLVTVASSMWWHTDEGTQGKLPERLQEIALVSHESALIFWASIDALKPAAIQSGDSFGVDGMSVQATYRQGDLVVSFDTWCPDAGSPDGMFVHLLYDLAWEFLKEPTSIDRLEQLHSYLDLGLPVRLLSGDVICLRLFGSLASYHERELRELFDTLPKESPLVVDMTNFDGMGTLLYPAFLAFASERPLLAWACSESAKRHIEAMRLPSPKVLDKKEVAIEWVKTQANRPQIT
jgi:hypothetical protein